VATEGNGREQKGSESVPEWETSPDSVEFRGEFVPYPEPANDWPEETYQPAEPTYFVGQTRKLYQVSQTYVAGYSWGSVWEVYEEGGTVRFEYRYEHFARSTGEENDTELLGVGCSPWPGISDVECSLGEDASREEAQQCESATEYFVAQFRTSLNRCRAVYKYLVFDGHELSAGR
jgi:hypothetical protein